MPQKSRSVHDGSCQNIRLEQLGGANAVVDSADTQHLHEESPPKAPNGAGSIGCSGESKNVS